MVVPTHRSRHCGNPDPRIPAFTLTHLPPSVAQYPTLWSRLP